MNGWSFLSDSWQGKALPDHYVPVTLVCLIYSVINHIKFNIFKRHQPFNSFEIHHNFHIPMAH